MRPVSRPISRGARLSTAACITGVRKWSFTEPMPYSPGWSVSTLTNSHVPLARVRMVRIPVIFGMR